MPAHPRLSNIICLLYAPISSTCATVRDSPDPLPHQVAQLNWYLDRHLPDRLKEAAATVDELLATEFLRVTAFAAADAAADDALARLVTAARTTGGDGGIDVASILQDTGEVRTAMLTRGTGCHHTVPPRVTGHRGTVYASLPVLYVECRLQACNLSFLGLIAADMCRGMCIRPHCPAMLPHKTAPPQRTGHRPKKLASSWWRSCRM